MCTHIRSCLKRFSECLITTKVAGGSDINREAHGSGRGWCLTNRNMVNVKFHF